MIWSKHRLPTYKLSEVEYENGEPTGVKEGELKPEGKEMVEEFVERVICGVGKEGKGDRGKEGRGLFERQGVLWFRNWSALQSVRALEHVHVLLRGDREVAEEVVMRGNEGEEESE